METIIVLDLETIPADDPRIIDYIATTIKPPVNIKLPASIAKWHAESKQEAIDEAVSRTGLDGAFGRVVVIGFDIDGTIDTIHGLDEAALLVAFNAKLNTIPRSMWSAMTIVGHNVAGFDLRFLMQRYIVNGIQPHPIINMAAQAKPWDASVYDTMTRFAGHGKTISLARLCLALGVPSSKGLMDGSMVGQYVADGRLDEVVVYCKGDVADAGAVYRRMTFGVNTEIKQAISA
jgi:hypothetical protein